MKFFDCVYNRLLMRYYKVEHGNGLRCVGRMIIQGHGKYKFGENVTIYSKKTINPIGGDRAVFQTMGNGKILIENHVGMSHVIFSSRSQIEVKDNVLLGSGVKIFDHDFHSLDYDNRINGGDTDIVAKPVLIEKGAFIGAHAIILKGVTIGERSIVGAGSVVTKSIPAGEIWAGNPARFIRKVENSQRK